MAYCGQSFKTFENQEIEEEDYDDDDDDDD